MGGLSFGGGFHGLYTFLKELIIGASIGGDEVTTDNGTFTRVVTTRDASMAREITTAPGFVARVITTQDAER